MKDLKYCVACLNSWHEFSIITRKMDIDEAVKCLESKQAEAKEKHLSNTYSIVKILNDADIASEKKTPKLLTGVVPCCKCGSTDIEFGDCGYTTFNVAWGKCKSCGHEVKISPCDCFITKDRIISTWNKNNDLNTICRSVLKKIEEGREEMLKCLEIKFK
jgi:hypothetical protein